MKKIVLAALAASSALIAVPASAQTVTGTITLTGSVDPKCFVLPGAGSTFSDTVGFGELAAADGTLRSGLAAEVTTAALSFRVLCTTASPDVSVDANALVAASAVATAGYADTINFDAHVEFDLAGGGSDIVDNDSEDAATLDTLSARLNGVGNNVTITADNFRTAAVTDILVADPVYSGSIIVTIAPGT